MLKWVGCLLKTEAVQYEYANMNTLSAFQHYINPIWIITVNWVQSFFWPSAAQIDPPFLTFGMLFA